MNPVETYEGEFIEEKVARVFIETTFPERTKICVDKATSSPNEMPSLSIPSSYKERIS